MSTSRERAFGTRKHTEEKPEGHGTIRIEERSVFFQAFLPCLPCFKPLIFARKNIRQTTERFQGRLFLAAMLPAADLTAQTRQRQRLHDAPAGAGEYG